MMSTLLVGNPFAEFASTKPLLTLLILLPLVGACFVGMLHSENTRTLRNSGLFFSTLAFAVALLVWRSFEDVIGFQLVDRSSLAPCGIAYAVGVDGISLLLVMLTALLAPIALWSVSASRGEYTKGLVISLLLLETGLLGSLLALDLFVFFVFCEVAFISMYLLIGIDTEKAGAHRTAGFLLHSGIGSALLLVGTVYLYQKTGSTSAALVDVLQVTLSRAEQLCLFVVFALSFAVRVPLFPFHSWLADAHTQISRAGTALLAGVLLTLGAYGLLRFTFPLFPEAVGHYSEWIMGLAAFGIVYGALVAYAQTDVRKLLAYYSISHMGLVVIGLFALTQTAVEGALLQMVNHGISVAGLCLCVGMLYERRQTAEIAEYGGIAAKAPRLATFFLIMTLASIGVPGTNGFVGEFMILAGTFQEALQSQLSLGLPFKQLLLSWRVVVTIIAAVATLGIVLGAFYMLSMFRRMMFGESRHEENEQITDMSAREVAYMLPLAVLVFVIGFFPSLFLGKMHRSVDAYIDHTRPRVTLERSPETVQAEEARRQAATQGAGGR